MYNIFFFLVSFSRHSTHYFFKHAPKNQNRRKYNFDIQKAVSSGLEVANETIKRSLDIICVGGGETQKRKKHPKQASK